jgi:hypothetical protein
MQDVVSRIAEDLGMRLHGPLTFRLILQPAMAVFLAVRAGLGDARGCRPAYLWAVLTSPEHRRALVHGGWKDISRVFGLGMVMDIAFQLIVFHTVYPFEMLLVAFLLAVVPYALLRGPVNRLTRKDCPEPGDPDRTS